MSLIDFLTDDREIYFSYRWVWILILITLALSLAVLMSGALYEGVKKYETKSKASVRTDKSVQSCDSKVK